LRSTLSSPLSKIDNYLSSLCGSVVADSLSLQFCSWDAAIFEELLLFWTINRLQTSFSCSTHFKLLFASTANLEGPYVGPLLLSLLSLVLDSAMSLASVRGGGSIGFSAGPGLLL
jgi:hypothetical protein